jgi:hypothetical protein
MVIKDVELVDESGNVIPVVEVRIDPVELEYEGRSARPVTAPTTANVCSRFWSTLTIRPRGGGKALGAFILTGLGTGLDEVTSTIICGVQLMEML